MCHVLYLISDCSLPTIKDNKQYPGLTVEAVSEDTSPPDNIGKLIEQAKYIYDVHPTDLCGCYFQYESNAEHEAELNDYINSLNDNVQLSEWFHKEYPSIDSFKQKERLFWQECRNAVTSFGQYLNNHIHTDNMMLYMTWCGDEGKPIEESQTITPAFFSGESCNPWKENALYTICADAQLAT